eukprot:SAG31_NODE_783_length_12123_cov_5.272130_11_plen_619_part_00
MVQAQTTPAAAPAPLSLAEERARLKVQDAKMKMERDEVASAGPAEEIKASLAAARSTAEASKQQAAEKEALGNAEILAESSLETAMSMKDNTKEETSATAEQTQQSKDVDETHDAEAVPSESNSSAMKKEEKEKAKRLALLVPSRRTPLTGAAATNSSAASSNPYSVPRVNTKLSLLRSPTRANRPDKQSGQDSAANDTCGSASQRHATVNSVEQPSTQAAEQEQNANENLSMLSKQQPEDPRSTEINAVQETNVSEPRAMTTTEPEKKQHTESESTVAIESTETEPAKPTDPAQNESAKLPTKEPLEPTGSVDPVEPEQSTESTVSTERTEMAEPQVPSMQDSTDAGPSELSEPTESHIFLPNPPMPPESPLVAPDGGLMFDLGSTVGSEDLGESLANLQLAEPPSPLPELPAMGSISADVREGSDHVSAHAAEMTDATVRAGEKTDATIGPASPTLKDLELDTPLPIRSPPPQFVDDSAEVEKNVHAADASLSSIIGLHEKMRQQHGADNAAAVQVEKWLRSAQQRIADALGPMTTVESREKGAMAVDHSLLPPMPASSIDGPIDAATVRSARKSTASSHQRVSTESLARLSASGAEVAQLLESLEAVRNLLVQGE